MFVFLLCHVLGIQPHRTGTAPAFAVLPVESGVGGAGKQTNKQTGNGGYVGSIKVRKKNQAWLSDGKWDGGCLGRAGEEGLSQEATLERDPDNAEGPACGAPGRSREAGGGEGGQCKGPEANARPVAVGRSPQR